MAFSITEEQRKEFEAFIAAHPIPSDYKPDRLDWAKTPEEMSVEIAYTAKCLLEQVDKQKETEEK